MDHAAKSANRTGTRPDGSSHPDVFEPVQRMEDFEAIAGICSYRRVLKPKLDGKSFRAAYQPEAAECCIPLPATIRRRIYQCRSY